MIFEARNSSRRCTTVTLFTNPARYSASSIAVSPPPTTATSMPRKKYPSQVAHALTPRFCSACSLGRSSQRALAPVAMITLCASSDCVSVQMRKGYPEKSTRSTSALISSVPKRADCFLNISINFGPAIDSGKPG
jgi:hypothetical protein